MRLFQLREIEEAYAHAANGGQALHMGGSAAGYPGAPACFRRAGTFAHLIDMNADRLQRTARSLGVRVVVVERPGRRGTARRPLRATAPPGDRGVRKPHKWGDRRIRLARPLRGPRTHAYEKGLTIHGEPFLPNIRGYRSQKMHFVILSVDGTTSRVSFDDWAYLSRFTWRTHKGGYLYRSSHGHTILMHREVARRGGFIARQIDHVNLDKTDNRRENLRPTDSVRNQYNVRSRRGSTSKFKGVYWCKAKRKWRAKICHSGGVITHIGYFVKEEDAARAYNEAASRLHGEFALLNEV